MKQQPLMLGWREWVGLPDLNIAMMKAKVDTGARTSSLHARITRRYEEDGRDMAEILVFVDEGTHTRRVAAVAPLVDERKIRSSNGTVQLRPIILTTLQVGSHRWRVEFSLTSRADMGFQMLVGRQALRRRAVVNPSRSFLLGKPLPPGEAPGPAAGQP